MFEYRHQPLLSRTEFLRRAALYAALAIGIVLLSLSIGILGYRYLEGLDWIDALLNAAMILSGMGPINNPQTVAGKLFASAYALFSGMVFLISAGVLFAPLIHRLLHRFHLGEVADED
ncbi:MAG: hypothetical protein GX552_16395 [Chloroflexi bacterium]|jgi:hypothetical protein|nr:hypothetical protein [Chloroflexota bacterium]